MNLENALLDGEDYFFWGYALKEDIAAYEAVLKEESEKLEWAKRLVAEDCK